MVEPKKVVKLRTVEWAALTGTRRDLLIALRDRLWEAMADERTQPRDLSPLTLRLKELQADIAAIDLQEEQEGSESAVPDEPFSPGDM